MMAENVNSKTTIVQGRAGSGKIGVSYHAEASRKGVERQNLERVNNELENNNTGTNQYATLTHADMELEVAAIIAKKRGSPQ